MTTENSASPLTRAWEQIVSTAERVGVPIATFGVGAWAIFIASARPELGLVVWLGSGLILASLGVYVWLTARGTMKAPPPPPIEMSDEMMKMLTWMREEISKQQAWAREQGRGSRTGSNQ